MAKSRPTPARALRSAILTAAESPTLRTVVEKAPVSRSVVRNYVAGSSTQDAVAASGKLVGQGLSVTLDFLGEDTTSLEHAQDVVAAYLDVLTQLGDAGLARNGNVEVSLKLSALGQKLAGGTRLSTEHALQVCERAADVGTTVTLDMEDHTTTDATLETLRSVRESYPWVGAVLQSYLRRTEGDCRDLAGSGSRVRLCKGAYVEPASVAYQTQGDIDRAYVRCMKILVGGEGYPMFATHDPRLVEIAQALVAHAGRSTDTYEFQMLNGIRPKAQRALAAAGETVRVYLPYGSEWYGYLMRRMAEKPSNTALFVRSLVRNG